jgi:hypothetical protein
MTSTRPIITVTRIDYYGVPYQTLTVEPDPAPDYAAIRREFNAAWDAENIRRAAHDGGRCVPVKSVERYFEIKLLNREP